jgi:predicted metal-dependent peptidase
MLCAALPHLSGLAYFIRWRPSTDISTIGITSLGLLHVNLTFWTGLELHERVFVLAHELLHLALDSHGRAGKSDALTVNVAHDYIINDMLAHELQQPVPAGGLTMEGARHVSLERLVLDLRRRNHTERPGWRGGESDLLEDDQNGPTATQLAQARKELARLAAEAVSVGAVRGASPGGAEQYVDALSHAYRVPWEAMLQRWFEGITPGERSYARASRRTGDRTDIVLPGRRREGWRLHIVLDVSGSMWSGLGECLGAIASCCDQFGVDAIRLLQCDADVAVDEELTPDALRHYRVVGSGGSDMSPALLRLNADPDVEAVVVLTDGYIFQPPKELRLKVLWVLPSPNRWFVPSVGEVITLKSDGIRRA